MQVTDIDLIKRVKNHKCSDSINKLTEKYSLVCLNIFHKYSPRLATWNISSGDFKDNIPYIIWKASETFDFKKKVSFCSWVSIRSKYHCLDIIRSNTQRNKICSLDSFNPEQHDSKIIPNIDNVDNSLFLNSIFKDKNQNIKKIFILRHYFELSWREIVEKIGISKFKCMAFYKEGSKILKNKLQEEKPCFKNQKSRR